MAKQSYLPGTNENSQHINVSQTESMAATEQPSFDLSDLKNLKKLKKLKSVISEFYGWLSKEVKKIWKRTQG